MKKALTTIIIITICSASAILIKGKKGYNGRLYGSAMQQDCYTLAEQVIPESNKGPSFYYPEKTDNRLYRLPWTAGKKFEIMDGYFSDPMGHPIWSDHPDYSLDFRMPEGEPILSARGGIVAKIFNKTMPGKKGPANYVVIQRMDTLDNGMPVRTRDWYEHVRNDIPVKKGDWIEQGQVIAYNSNSGCFHMHLHFEVNMKDHKGKSYKKLGGDGRTITSIPTPFIEVDRRGGYPVLGEYWVSQNRGGLYD